MGGDRQAQFKNRWVVFGLKVRASSFFLLALHSAQIHLQPPSSLGVASFLLKGEVVFKSESQELRLPLSWGGCYYTGGREGPIQCNLWI